MEYLAAFEKRVYVCAFPHLPVELSKSEIERFLTDPARNARMCPDMLAVIFAAIALGAQHSVWDKAGGQWSAELIDAESQRGNVYGKFASLHGFALLTKISGSFNASPSHIVVHAQAFFVGC